MDFTEINTALLKRRSPSVQQKNYYSIFSTPHSHSYEVNHLISTVYLLWVKVYQSARSHFAQINKARLIKDENTRAIALDFYA
ncbi:hypothetical protein JYQ62_06865 [Nostoc sp. UHCC 0702]|nr:hypothetical protein JYQ62_06865 [Nostoc sp. UHCC 0702]